MTTTTATTTPKRFTVCCDAVPRADDPRCPQCRQIFSQVWCEGCGEDLPTDAPHACAGRV